MLPISMRCPMLRRIRNGRKDGGATSVMVVTMVLAMTAAMPLFVRLAQAGELRTRAQTGADATALGTLAPLRDRAVEAALQGSMPQFVGYWAVTDEPEVAADRSAALNKVRRAGDVNLTGLLGNTAK